LFKNRITGTQDKELGVYFDSPSYRLWSTKEELDKVFKWDKNKYKMIYQTQEMKICLNL